MTFYAMSDNPTDVISMNVGHTGFTTPRYQPARGSRSRPEFDETVEWRKLAPIAESGAQPEHDARKPVCVLGNYFLANFL